MKKYFISFLLIVGILFVNISGVNAVNVQGGGSSGSQNCTCYYSGRLLDSDSGGANETHYLASMTFNREDFDSSSNKDEYRPNISFFGENMYHTDTEEGGKIEDETSKAEWVLDGAGVEESQVTSLFDSGCDCSSLGTLTFLSQSNSKELYYNVDKYYNFWPNFGIFEYNRVDMKLITYEQFKEQKESENVADTSGSQGLSGIEAILEWTKKEDEYDLGDVGNPCSIINTNLKNLLSAAFWFISVAAIILIVVMTAIGFIKAIVGSDDEKLKTAFSHLITRLIVVFILLLLPMLLTFIINIVNDNIGGTVKVGANGDVFCEITK